MTFEDLGLSDKVLQAISETGYTTPTPIQEKAIPYVLMGRDILGCAQTGTGKTASFTLPMIDILTEGRAKARMPRSLILAPTRELATQVAESFERYGKHHRLIKALLIGGTSMADQEQALDRGADVLIATPGRLIDLFERGKVLLADVRILVIDEADRMLDMGFIPDVERIVAMLPTIRQTLFFSATMPKEIRRLADQFLLNPKEISVTPPASPAETVTQGLVRCPGADKRKALQSLLAGDDVSSALVFCNRKRDVAALAKALKKQGHPAGELHGDMSQPERTETLASFKSGDFSILVCSDVAARGLDLPLVSHVFNYDVPGHPEDYVHRIGRTGRAGRSGTAYTIATPADGKALLAIEKAMNRSIPAVELDNVRELSPEAVEGVAEPAAVVEGRKASAGKSADGKAAEGKGKSRRRGGRRKAAAGTVEAPAQPPANENASEAPPAAAAQAGGSGPANGRRKSGGSNGRRSDKAADRRQTSNGRQSKPFGDHTPAFLLRPVPASATA